jgi:hypothetical protein
MKVTRFSTFAPVCLAGIGDLPATIADRSADVWEPLLGIAEAIGGDWYRDALTACEVITASQPEAISAGVRLLTDIRDVWTPGATAMPSQTLCDELTNVDDGP